MDPMELIALLEGANTPPDYGVPKSVAPIRRKRKPIEMDAPTPGGIDPNRWTKLPNRAGGTLGLPTPRGLSPHAIDGPISLEEALMASVRGNAPNGPRLFDPDMPPLEADPNQWFPEESSRFGTFNPQVDPSRVHAQDFEFRRGAPASVQAGLGPFRPDDEMLMAMFPDASPEEIAYIKAATSAGLRGSPDAPELGTDPELSRAIQEADEAAGMAEERHARDRAKTRTMLSADIEQPNQFSLAGGDLGTTIGTPERPVGSIKDIREPDDYIRAMTGGTPSRGNRFGLVGRHPLKFAGGLSGLSMLADIINDPEGAMDAGRTLVTDPLQFAQDVGTGTLQGFQALGSELADIGSDISKDINYPRGSTGPRTDINQILNLIGGVTGITPIAQAGNKVGTALLEALGL